jgi:hypothetical protein
MSRRKSDRAIEPAINHAGWPAAGGVHDGTVYANGRYDKRMNGASGHQCGTTIGGSSGPVQSRPSACSIHQYGNSHQMRRASSRYTVLIVGQEAI